MTKGATRTANQAEQERISNVGQINSTVLKSDREGM